MKHSKKPSWLTLNLFITKSLVLLLALTSCGKVNLSSGSLSQGQQTSVIADSIIAEALAGSSTNLLNNAGFENGLSGWDDYGNARALNSAVYQGAYALQVGTAAGGVGQNILSRLKAGATYRLSGYAKLVKDNEYAHFAADFKDASGKSLLTKSASITSADYKYYSFDFVFPSNSASAEVSIWKNAGMSTLYVDALKLVMLATPIAVPAPIAPPAALTSALAIANPTIGSANLTAGQLQIAKVSLVANTDFLNKIVSVRILNSSSQIVFEKYLQNVDLPAGSTTPYQLDYPTSSSLAAGTYSAIIGVWSADWAITHLYETIGSFQVVSSAQVPAPAPLPVPVEPVPTPAPPASSPGVLSSGQGYPFGSRKIPYVAGIRPTSATQAAQETAVQNLYNSWKQTLRTSCGGYYVQFNSSYASVSEGIGYGMLITAVMSGYDSNARNIFDGLFTFARSKPAYMVDPALMDWRVNNDCTSAGDGYNAMDGDLDIAMGLLMADIQWGSTGAINYKAEAIKTITALKNKNMNSAGYTMGGPASDLSRTSDYMITHFRAFKRATGDGYWDTVINKSFELMSLMQNNFAPNTGLIPDFIVGLPGNPYPSPGGRIESLTEGFFAWNGCRIPWRLGSDYVTSGDDRSKVVTGKIMDFLNNVTGGNAALITMGYKLDGTPLSTPTTDWTSPSFAGPATVGAMVDPRFQNFLNSAWNLDVAHPAVGYYDYELQMLSMIVASGNWWNP